MKRYRQTIDEILEQLSAVDTGWRDSHAEEVIRLLESMPKKDVYTRQDLIELLQPENQAAETSRFEAGLTLVRLFLDLSKDEFTARMRDLLGKGHGVIRARNEPEQF